MHHHRGTQTGFVGEHAALEALHHHGLDGNAGSAAHRSHGSESGLEDRAESGNDVGVVDADDHNAAQNEQHHHEGHHLLREGSHALEAAQRDGSSQRHQHKADDQAVEGDAFVQGHIGQSGNAERGFNVHHDLVDLTHGADAEGGQQGEDGEQHRQHLTNSLAALLGAQTIAQVVHGTAGPLAVFVAAAVVDAQHVFGVVGHHAKESGDPHPEHSAGAADDDGSRHTRDITNADGGSQRGAQRLEGRHSALVAFVGDDFFLEQAADGVLPPQLQLADLKHLGHDGGQKAGGQQQHQTQRGPDEGIDHIVARFKGFEELFHVFCVPFRTNKK